jgi:hypothetical protein
MNKFIKSNDLVKRIGFDEWYTRDGKSRVVKIGDRYRLDVRRHNWSIFNSYYILGPREREFKSVVGRQRWVGRPSKKQNIFGS